MSKYEAQTAWKAKNTTRVVMDLNHNTDADLIRYLESVSSKQGVIKEALRKHIASVTSTDECK